MRRMTERARRFVAGLAATLAVAVPMASASAAALSVQRSEGQISAVNGKNVAVSLAAQATIPALSRIQTVGDGRLALLIEGGGLLVLGMDSELLFDSSEPMDPPARAVLLRLHLNSGALRVDARKRDLAPPADVRLTLPKLSMRIYGGEAWIQSAPDGDEVCALSGAVEIQTPNGKDRLDRPNECLRWGDAGGEHLEPGRRRGLAIDFLRTSFVDDPEAQYAAQQELNRGTTVVLDTPAPEPASVPVPAAAVASVAPTDVSAPAVSPVGTAMADTAPPAASPQQTMPPETAVAPTAIAAPGTAAAASASGRWCLVLGSYGDRQQAERLRQRWPRLQTRVSEAAGIDRIYYRVLSGDYASKAAAEAALKKLPRDKTLSAAWALQLP